MGGGSHMSKAFSSVDIVNQCLFDKARTSEFEKAISQNVKPGDVVLDLGTGSGILALLSARAGARKVVAIEYDPYIMQLARENIARNGFERCIEVIEADATMCQFEKGIKFDVVIAELVTTGMIDEVEVQAINNIHANDVLKKTTVFIPSVQATYARLAHVDYSMLGFDMRTVMHFWKEHRLEDRISFASDKELFDSVHFDRVVDENVKVDLTFTITEPMKINTVYLESFSTLGKDQILGYTPSLNAPVAIPLQRDIDVVEGQEVRMQFSYIFGQGYGNFMSTEL